MLLINSDARGGQRNYKLVTVTGLEIVQKNLRCGKREVELQSV